MSPPPARPAIEAKWNRAPLPHVRHVIAVASGKGGVGKSTTTVNLAHALTRLGKKVGILDADIHGPSIPRMLGIEHSGQPEVKEGMLLPITGHLIATMSMGHIANDQAAVWRGPMVTKALVQMLRNVQWGTESAPLDVLLIDMPPGTGDTHISLVQNVPLSGVIIVTTPQSIATADAEKCLEFFKKVQAKIFGIVENMSYFSDSSGQPVALFGEGGGASLAKRHHCPLLAQIPMDPMVGACCDEGKSLWQTSDNDAQVAYESVARAIIASLQA